MIIINIDDSPSTGTRLVYLIILTAILVFFTMCVVSLFRVDNYC